MSNLPDPSEATVLMFSFDADEAIPNHPAWPLMCYKGVLPPDPGVVEALFEGHAWGGTWRDGIYPYPHYHSTAHEALGLVRGRARVRFGGAEGEVLDLEAGDVAVLPAGTGHQRLDASSDLLVVGAYPRGQEDRDTLRADAAALAAARERIAKVPRPEQDPVYGADGPLLRYWKST